MSLLQLARPASRSLRSLIARRAPSAAAAASSYSTIPQPPAPLGPRTSVGSSRDAVDRRPERDTGAQSPENVVYLADTKAGGVSKCAIRADSHGVPAQRARCIGMIEQDPIRLVNARKAVCDGGESASPLSRSLGLTSCTGGGPLGHPKIFINLDKPGELRVFTKTEVHWADA